MSVVAIFCQNNKKLQFTPEITNFRNINHLFPEKKRQNARVFARGSDAKSRFVEKYHVGDFVVAIISRKQFRAIGYADIFN